MKEKALVSLSDLSFKGTRKKSNCGPECRLGSESCQHREFQAEVDLGNHTMTAKVQIFEKQDDPDYPGAVRSWMRGVLRSPQLFRRQPQPPPLVYHKAEQVVISPQSKAQKRSLMKTILGLGDMHPLSPRKPTTPGFTGWSRTYDQSGVGHRGRFTWEFEQQRVEVSLSRRVNEEVNPRINLDTPSPLLSQIEATPNFQRAQDFVQSLENLFSGRVKIHLVGLAETKYEVK